MDLTFEGLCGMVVLHRKKEDVLKVFVMQNYLLVVKFFLSGISPEEIRNHFDGLIERSELEGYLVDVRERYEDVIKWS